MSTDELRKLAEAATPGPWESVPGARARIERTIITKGRLAVAVHANPPDAAYIAAASPQAVLALLDERDGYKRAFEESERDLQDTVRELRAVEAERDRLQDRSLAYQQALLDLRLERDRLRDALRSIYTTSLLPVKRSGPLGRSPESTVRALGDHARAALRGADE